MSFIHDFLHRHAVDLVGKLVHSGFSNGQAQVFLLETPGKILNVLSGPESDAVCCAAPGDGAVAMVIAGLDVPELAARAEIEPSLADSGLKTLIPTLLAFFREFQTPRRSDVQFPTVH